MSYVTQVRSTLRNSLAAMKAAWLRWNERQLDAGGNIFQHRVDPLSGGSQYSRAHPNYYV